MFLTFEGTEFVSSIKDNVLRFSVFSEWKSEKKTSEIITRRNRPYNITKSFSEPAVGDVHSRAGSPTNHTAQKCFTAAATIGREMFNT